MKIRLLCVQTQQVGGTPFAYGVLDETTYTFALLDTQATHNLILQYGCDTITTKQGIPDPKEVAKLPHLTLQNEIYKNNGIFVIGRFVQNNENIGYLYATPYGKVQKFDTKQALALAARTTLLNGIVVNQSFIKGKGFTLPVIDVPKSKKNTTLEKISPNVKPSMDEEQPTLNYVDFESLVYDKLNSPKMPDFLLHFIGFNHYDKNIMTDQALAWAYLKRSNQSINKYIKLLQAME